VHQAAEFARRLQESEGYQRKILGVKWASRVPENARPYGDGVTFLCYEATEALQDERPVCLRAENVLCGGAVYCGIGSRKISRQDLQDGMEMIVGPNRAYSSRETMRRVNQQIPHHFETRKYMVMGQLEQMEDPEVVMIITDPQRVMRLCKAYTWKTGEVVHALGGTCWCGMSFPQVLRDKTMTFNFGDPPARTFMELEDSEMFCVIHWDLLPLIVDNLQNVSTGEGY